MKHREVKKQVEDVMKHIQHIKETIFNEQLLSSGHT